jgi:hypothetical protein
METSLCLMDGCVLVTLMEHTAGLKNRCIDLCGKVRNSGEEKWKFWAGPRLFG